MQISEVVNAVETNSMSVDLADKYLKLYVADIDWRPHIAALWSNASKKYSDEVQIKDYVKRAISCTTILPLVEKTQIPDPPSNLLFWCTGWKQFNENDWFDLFLSVLREDIKIQENRNKVIEIGVIERVDVSPITRQAYNWLYERVLEDKSVSEDSLNDIKAKMINLVRAYGGASICNVFVKYKNHVDKIMNWRSGYFFEKELHKIYNVDQLIKIKSAELSKTNSKYIKTA